jgi:hypothetical protein
MNRSWQVDAVATLLFCYGLLALWHVVADRSALYLLWAAPSIAAAAGLVLSRGWSRWLVYVIAACVVSGWAAYTVVYARAFPLESMFRLFALGAVLSCVSAWSCLVVRRHFQSRRTLEAPTASS